MRSDLYCLFYILWQKAYCYKSSAVKKNQAHCGLSDWFGYARNSITKALKDIFIQHVGAVV